MAKCLHCCTNESTLECRDCASSANKEETKLEVMLYCDECSAGVHRGPVFSRHELVRIPKIDLEESSRKLDAYKRQIDSLTLKKKELKHAEENINEQQRMHERALRSSVHTVQEMLMNHAKECRQRSTGIVMARIEALQTCFREHEEKINEMKKIEQQMTDALTSADIPDGLQELEKLNIEEMAKIQNTIPSLFVNLPVVNYAKVIDAIRNLELQEDIECQERQKTINCVCPYSKAEGTKTSIVVSSPLSRRGTFWAYSDFDEEVSLRLNTLNLDIRTRYISDPCWKTYKENGTYPEENDLVYVKYRSDQKWYRGCVEKAQENQCEVRFIDYGILHTVGYDRIMPQYEDLFPGLQPQAVECSLFSESKTIENEAVWYFTALTDQREIQASFEHQMEVDGRNVWYVKLTSTDDTGSGINIQEEVEKRNEKKVVKNEAVIVCTDVRLADNPDFQLNTESAESLIVNTGGWETPADTMSTSADVASIVLTEESDIEKATNNSDIETNATTLPQVDTMAVTENTQPADISSSVVCDEPGGET